MIRRLLAAGVLAIALAACAAGAKFQQPQLQVVNVQLLKGDLAQQQLRVRLRVDNPNDRALPIRGISYQMEVAGDPFAHGESEHSFEVPAHGMSEFDVGVTANAAGTILRLLGGGLKSDQIDYRLVGKVSLAKGVLRSIPFDQKGKFSLR